MQFAEFRDLIEGEGVFSTSQMAVALA